MKLLPKSRFLCERCTRMTSTLEGLRELASAEGYRHLTVVEVHKLAASGCPFCAILKNNHKRSPHPAAFIQLRLRFPVRRDGKAQFHSVPAVGTGHPFEIAKLDMLESVILDDSMNYLDLIEGRDHFQLSGFGRISTMYPFTGPDDPAAQFTNINDDDILVSGPEITQEITKRINLCFKTHKSCPEPDESCLPTRVIDVHPESGDDRVCIHITSSHDKFRYLALSYCWGGAQELTTTKATLMDRQHGMRLCDLPPTIHDAIQVTRDLGFRYLWLDALCIIQDDTEDKNMEINRMGSIYKNATLTIAAANTTSVQESFLTPRPIPQCCTLPYLLPNGTYGTLWIKDKFPNWILSPLDSRAWALQESLLSPRILWYGPADLKWKCQEAQFADIWNTHNYDFKYPPSRHRRLPKRVFGLPWSYQTDLHQRGTEMWSDIMGDYSGRDLTFAEDRLPALAGVASELQKIWMDDYLAGLWRKSLVKHLGWFQQKESMDDSIYDYVDGDSITLHLPGPGQYHSPGWTWTSFQGRIAVKEVVREHAEIIECQVALADEKTPFSRVTSGKLVLKAACITESERLKMENSRVCWDYNDCEQENHINHVNQTFVYALLGDTGGREGGMKAVALVLAPVGDGNFMRIGLLFNFDSNEWKLESRGKRKMTII